MATLEESVKQMSDYQLGVSLSEAQVNSIITWLKSLTGEIPVEYIRKPALPPSTKMTPKPETAD